MEIPKEYAWGLELAILRLRPGSSFGLGAKVITDWQDPNGLEPPTWDEIEEQMKQDKIKFDIWVEQNNMSHKRD